jgi:hypothetical protein
MGMGRVTVGRGAWPQSFAQLDGDHVVWSGGGGAMYDLATDPQYTDVKKLTRMSSRECAAMREGYTWKLRMPEGGRFAEVSRRGEDGPERRRTHLALVRFEPDPVCVVRPTPTGVGIHVEFAAIRIALATTGAVNEWIAPVGQASWAYLPDEVLADGDYAEYLPGGVVRRP